jgi:hypothetical protein
MVPGFVGDNIADVLAKKPGRNWEELPATVSQYGTTPEQIFAGWSAIHERFGNEAVRIPLGAVAIATFVEKLRTGLTQFMAGARSFRLDSMDRSDIVALTEEAAKVSGITYIMDAFKEDADRILEN